MFDKPRPTTAALLTCLLAAQAWQPIIRDMVADAQAAHAASQQFNDHLRALEGKLEVVLAAPDDTYPVTDITCEGDYWRPNESIVCRSSSNWLPHRVGRGASAQVNFPSGIYFSRINAVVLSADASESIEDHEERHRRQGQLPIQTAADSIMVGTYYEADARLDEIITAYQVFLRTGDQSRWNDLRGRDPEMLAVFDGMVRESPEAQQALRDGRDPSAEIMRITALSYVFTATARYYVNQTYFPNLGHPRRPEISLTDDLPPDWQNTVDLYHIQREDFFTNVIDNSPITISPLALAEALARDGVPYIYDPNMPQMNPLHRDVYGYLSQSVLSPASARRFEQALDGRCVRWQPREEAGTTIVVTGISSNGLRPRLCGDEWVSKEGLTMQSVGLGSAPDDFFAPPELGDYPLGMTAQEAYNLRPYAQRRALEMIAAANLTR